MFSIIGYGSHAKDCLAIGQRASRSCVAIFDDNPAVAEPPPNDLFGFIILGTNYPQQRKELAERFIHATPAKPLIDPSAIVGPDCNVGDGSVIAPLALLLTDVTLGQHVHVNYQASMTRCTIGDFTTISPGATICGDVAIGNGCLIGANSTVADRSSIGDNVVIAAGAILPPLSEVPDGTTVIGVWRNATGNA